MPVTLDLEVKLAVYRHFARYGSRPSIGRIAAGVGASVPGVAAAYARLREARVLLLEADGESIRMAPPFSGIPTQHLVEAGDVIYFANCAWDALGIPAALHRPATVRSRCEQSREPFELPVSPSGPPLSDWLFHCAIPAARWWDDLVLT